MNKRGQEEQLLTEETFKIIVSVICIGVLVAVIVGAYFSLTGNQAKKMAQDMVNGNHGIASEIRRINVGGMDNSSFPVWNPSGWWIFSFVEGDKKPNTCAGANCLCICEKLRVGVFDVENRQAQRCDDKGACVAVFNLEKFDTIQIKGGGTYISIRNVNEQIQIAKK